jgi:ATP-dependent helicase/DNAse subunit B
MSKILEAMKEKFISFISKEDDSNFVKKLKMLAEEMEIVQTAFDDIEDVKSLNDAYGKTLDYYGANVGESRKGNDDTLYRLLIRIKIAENTSDGSIPYLI